VSVVATPGRTVLVLGGAAAGKTTFLVQLHGRVSAGTSALRAREAAASLAPIEAAYRRLQQGKAVGHTAQGTDVTLAVPAVDAAGRAVDILVPDYAGEDLFRVVVERTIPRRWRDAAAESDEWLLLIRLTKHAILPDILTRPIGELAWEAVVEPPDGPLALPSDMAAVELLQALLYARGQDERGSRDLPRLTLVLSCWDELHDVAEGTEPGDVTAERIALLDSFCRATWGPRYRVMGLSAQGCALDDAEPAEEFLDNGPERMGWIVTADGSIDPDLTLLVEAT